MFKTKPEPALRVSGGNPTGLPDYKPINKLPDHEIRALLKEKLRPALYQVRVEWKGKGDTAVGPKCQYATADALAQAIKQQIRLGREQEYSNPHVVLTL